MKMMELNSGSGSSDERKSTEEHFLSFHADDIFETVSYLESQKVFEESGIFLTDSDYTLRTSAKEFLSGYPDRISLKSQELLLKVHNHKDWDVAIITDQPDKGHQVGTVVGKIRGYTPFLEFAKQNKIEVLGGYNDPVRFVLKEKGTYKKYPRALDETMELLQRKNYKDKKNLVWVGDTKWDVEYGVRLEKKLRNDGYEGKFYLFKVDRGDI
ncbi:hypothetical protein A2V49_01870 [candidate division WWE3 bacterium RBG_19FT_COMBO_34_6]|uniref:Uncharacterized protein n=1 Tax=candidate division WWE3 bacterium RBG_19FT_COMBO_34_6 TaxID=1802612 RepID=A0A1F4UKP0_UNCKA|nr:MAG: hypothetical protein A2V49_01870 [candidate division WWE3 bacterium RBG_19FT_COMBO_34_6]